MFGHIYKLSIFLLSGKVRCCSRKYDICIKEKLDCNVSQYVLNYSVHSRGDYNCPLDYHYFDCVLGVDLVPISINAHTAAPILLFSELQQIRCMGLDSN